MTQSVCRVSSPVQLEIEDSGLRQSMLTALNNLGVRVAEQPRTGDSIVLANANRVGTDERGARVVQVWTGNRATRKINPFGTRNTRHVVSAECIDAAELCSTLEHVEGSDLASFERMMGQGLTLQTHQVSRTDQKEPTITAMRAFMERAGARSTLVTSLEVCCDELFTNALYNAPYVDGARPYSHMSRAVSVVSERPITVRFGHSDGYYGIAVRDEYGSLAAEAVVDSLFRCYRTTSPSPVNKEGGAGLGFFMLLQNASRMVVNIAPHDHTEIMVLRRAGERGRQFAERCPTLNICVDGTRRYDLERRNNTRHPVAWRGTCVVGTSQLACEVLDISTGGAFVVVPEDQIGQLGAPVTLTAAAPGCPQRTMKGVLAWRGWSRMHRRHGFGVQFAEPVTEIGTWLRACDGCR